MSSKRDNVPKDLTEEFSSESRHICLIFDNEEQRRKIVTEYLATGIRQGELVRYGVDVTAPEEVRSWLLEMGVHFPDDKENGAFRIFNAKNYYCPDGRFEPQKLIDVIPSRYELAKQAGYKGVRSSSEMSWVLRDGIPGSERLLEYEVLLNTVYPRSGMCQYDARLFNGAMLFNVLKVHPFMIAQGQVVRNPYYVTPEEFLSEIKSKKE
jgi:hypothetical protein